MPRKHPYQLLPTSAEGCRTGSREVARNEGEGPRTGSREVAKNGSGDIGKVVHKFTFIKEKGAQKDNEILKAIMICVILANVLVLGVQEEWQTEQVEYVCECCSNVCSACYVAECIFEMCVFRCDYFKDGWKLFNFTLSVLSCVELSAIAYNYGVLADHLHKANLLRMLRVIRVVRVVRALNSIPDLIMVVDGITKALKSLWYVGILFFILVYVFAIFFTLAIGGEEWGDSSFDQHKFFGSMGLSMITMFNFSLQPEFQRQIAVDAPWLLIPMFLFMAVTTLGILNVIIALMIESTWQSRDDAARARKEEQLAQAVGMWQEQVPPEGEISRELRCERMLGVLERIIQERVIPMPEGITSGDLLILLDSDGDMSLNVEEFEMGLGRFMFGDSFKLTTLMCIATGQARNDLNHRIDEVTHEIEQIKHMVALLSQ